MVSSSDTTVLSYWLSCLFSPPLPPQSTPCHVRWRRGNGCSRSSPELRWNFFAFCRHWPTFSLTGNPENKDGAIQNGVKELDWGHARMQPGRSDNQKIAEGGGIQRLSTHSFSFKSRLLQRCRLRKEEWIACSWHCVSPGWGVKLKHFDKYLISQIFISEISQNETKSNRKRVFFPCGCVEKGVFNRCVVSGLV